MDKIENHSKTYKRSYISEYGADYPKPKLDDFGLTKDLYFSYNRRFSIDYETFAFLSIPVSLIVQLSIVKETGFRPALLGIAFAGLICVIVRFTLLKVEHFLQARWPQDKMVKEYAKAREIYIKVQKEAKGTEYFSFEIE